MSVEKFWKGFLLCAKGLLTFFFICLKGFFKFFLLCAGADGKRNQNVGRSYDPMDEKYCPLDPAHLSMNEQMIHEAKVNAEREA